MNLYDARLQNKSTILVAGPSQCGKTTLVEKIVYNKDNLFTNEIKSVYWFCAYTPTNKIDGVKYTIGLPNNFIKNVEPYSLVIIDDFMKELSNSNELTLIMTKVVHHVPITLIFITQNLFQKGNDMKTRRLNTNYLILFNNPHDKAQVDYIGRQMYPKDKLFLSSAFNDATMKSPYSYLFIDCHQSTPDEIRVRTNITGDKLMKVYVPPTIMLNV